MNVSSTYRDALKGLSEELEIPEYRYEQAEGRYKSVGTWLARKNSTLLDANPRVYVQGSFALGTAIRPISNEEDYDIDLVCELGYEKSDLTQFYLKELLGRELDGYASAHQMQETVESRRCWILNYADGAQFHLDALPAVPDGVRQRLLLEQRGFDATWADTAISITDRLHQHYKAKSPNWPHSNPRGFANWFRSRMGGVFEARRGAIALKEHKSVQDVPDYRVRTPLQSAVQILKRHRDVMFLQKPEEKPISVIIATLAAHAYEQETEVSDAVLGIAARMPIYVERRAGNQIWIPNPTDPGENFADKWLQYPAREQAFLAWLSQVQQDLQVSETSRSAVLTELSRTFGDDIAESALKRATGGPVRRFISGAARLLSLNPAHKQTPPWRQAQQGNVEIQRATFLRDGFRPTTFSSNSERLPKKSELTFEASTDVPAPFEVYWQVVNTGDEAEVAGDLRGGFDRGEVSVGKLVRREHTRYSGRHSIECFIIKNGLLAARSGQFIVQIA